MTGKFVAALVLLCVCQLALGDDLAKEKKEIFDKIQKLHDESERAYKKSNDVYHKRPVHLYPIKNRFRDLGESLLEMSLIEINQGATEAKQKAKLVADFPKVYECIEAKKEETARRLQKAFTDGYPKVLDNLLDQAIRKKMDLAGQFSSNYYKLMEELRVRWDIAEDQINNTNNKGYLVSIFEEYEKFMARIIKELLSLEPMFVTNEINFDRTLQNGPVKGLRAYGRKTADNFFDNVASCLALV